MTYYLAIDIGASSGRHMLGHRADGKLVLEEVYRFPNGMIKRDGQLVWDVDALLAHILEGMRRCGELGKIPRSVGIDTWGVDFVLLDAAGNRLGEAVAYRDRRTQGMEEAVEAIIPFPELYGRVGIQKMVFNTIYQLMAVKHETPERLEQASTFLMVPDYFHYCLSGKASNEYTEATTTAMIDAKTKTWDRELIDRLGLPQTLFTALHKPGDVLGPIKPEIAAQVGYVCDIVLPATHDTASAYLAVPATDESALYLSSGTWSLMGVESFVPILNDAARAQCFTNEGGADGRICFMKNIMGLWMLQEVYREIGEKYSFPELSERAKASGPPVAIVDVNNNAFLAPESMIEAVKTVARESGQTVPEDLGQVLQCIFHSLAACYAQTARDLEQITGRTFTSLHIVGGGSKNDYLNALTAAATGCTVYAGPTEATVAGNIMVQMITAGELTDVQTGRKMIRDSFAIATVTPLEGRS